VCSYTVEPPYNKAEITRTAVCYIVITDQFIINTKKIKYQNNLVLYIPNFVISEFVIRGFDSMRVSLFVCVYVFIGRTIFMPPWRRSS